MAKKLLLADDSITIQKVVELVLSEEDFQIKAVNNGQDALKQFEVFKPDIVLADIEMPQVNGYQLCEKIKKNPLGEVVPVVLLAGAFEPLDEELAKNVGADGYIIKPFESQELISKVNAALTSASIGTRVSVKTGEAAGIAEEAAISSDFIEVESGEIVEAVSGGQEEDLWAMEEVEVSGDEESSEEAWQIEDNSGDNSIEEIAAETIVMDTPLVNKNESVKTALNSGKGVASLPDKVTSSHIGPQPVTSEETIVSAVRQSVQEQIIALMPKIDFRALIEDAVSRYLRESIEGILKENASALVKKSVQEILNGAFSSLKADMEKVIWESVPDLAENIIKKEIERIKAEY